MKSTVIDRLVDSGLCSGCGLCAGILPDGKVAMAMTPPGLLRPHVTAPLSNDDQHLVRAVCPGRSIVYSPPQAGAVRDPFWGPILDCFTGYATDGDLRRWGSSGGFLSGLLCHLLATKTVDLVVQVAADPDNPLRNAVSLSRTREDVLRAAGSRYAPSAPLASIGAVLEGTERAVFVGKPCDVAGLRALARIDPRVDQRIPLMLAFMCAGIPSETGTVEVLDKLGMAPAKVTDLRYRGDGWPGVFRARDTEGREATMDYATSWGTVLNRHIQWRCKICPDGTGDFADLVCADAWFEDGDGLPTFNERDGRSLVLTRTAKGRSLLVSAWSAGAVAVERQDVEEISRMQPFQKKRRQLVLSRLLAMAVLLRPTPVYSGAGLWRAAVTARPLAQVRSFAGTLLRLLRRRAVPRPSRRRAKVADG